MSEFGVKAKVTLDQSSKAAFQNEIQTLCKEAAKSYKIDVKISTGKKALTDQINSKIGTIKIGSEIKVAKSGINSAVKQINSALSAKPITIKVGKIDASSAVRNVRNQLQTMLSALSVKNGVNIGGLKDFIDTDGMSAAMAKTTAAADTEINKLTQAKEAVNMYAAEIKSLEKLSSSVWGSLNSAQKDKNTTGKSKELSAYAEEYSKINKKIAQAKAGGYSDTELSQIRQESIALQDKIKLLQQEAAAQAKAAASADKKVATDQKEQENLQKRQAELQTTERLASDLNKLQTKLDSSLRNSTKATSWSSSATEQYNQLKKYKETLQSLTKENPKSGEANIFGNDANRSKAREVIDSVSVGMENCNAKIKAAGENSKSLFSTLTSGAAKFTSWFGISQVIMQSVTAIRQMVTNVRELDTAMTELRKVTNESESTYKTFFDGAVDRAQKYGATVSDTITATADASKLGLNLKDASTLADASVVYKNVGDDISSISDASSSIISTMKAFGVEASNAMSIVDKFNEVGNNFAITSDGIGEALKRSAASLSAGGNTLDESIGLITGANEIIQDPESVGKPMPNNTVMY